MPEIQCPTGRVFQYQVGSGRVLEKILSSRSGSGGVGELKYTIRHSQASFLLSGSSGYSWLFPGISGFIGYHLFLAALAAVYLHGQQIE